MKKLYFLFLTIATAAMFFGCKKDNNAPEPEPEIKLDSMAVKDFLNKVVGFNSQYENPKAGSTDSRCFNNPITLATDKELYEPIDVKLHTSVYYTYRYQIASYSITDPSGEEMATDYNLNGSNYLIDIQHKELKPNTEYTVSVTIQIAQFVDGEWQPVIYKTKNTEYSCTIKFTTDALQGNTIDKRDILYQYPIDRQYNYMSNEYKQGYLMLSYSYHELFDGISESDKKVIVKSVNDSEFADKVLPFTTKECHDVPTQAIEINYSLENVEFTPRKVYCIQLVAGENTIYEMYFRTSRFNTLSEKLKAYDIFDGKAAVYGSDPILKQMTRNMEMDEFFDKLECQQFITKDGITTQAEHLIHMELDLDNCEWYKNTFKTMYDQHTLSELNGQYRYLKFPPSDDIAVFNAYLIQHPYLTDEEIATGITTGLPEMGSLGFYFVFQMYEDSRQLKHKIDVETIFYSKGEYPYYISFVLPGKNIVTTKEKHAFIVE